MFAMQQRRKETQYSKGWMKPYLNRYNVNRLAPYIVLPKTVVEAQAAILWTIEQNPSLKANEPGDVVDNLIKFAENHKTFTGEPLNLTVDAVPQDFHMSSAVASSEFASDEECEVGSPKKRTPKKSERKIPMDVDELQLVEKIEAVKKKKADQKKQKLLKELRRLEEEDEPE
jgi:hypothetical protein